MHSKKIFSDKLIYILIGVVLSIFLMFIEYNFTQNHNSKIIFEDFQDKINSEYQNLTKNGEKFTYVDNKISAWTTNSIPIPIILDSTINNNIVELQNGLYIIKKENYGDTINIYLSLVKSKYDIRNQYIKNSFNPIFEVEYEENIEISKTKTSYPITINNETAFYLKIEEGVKGINSLQGYLSCIIFFIIFYFILISIAIIYRKYINIGNISLLIIFVIIKELIFYFKWPTIVFNTIMFSPFLYANSEYISSFAELIISIIIVYVWISNFKIKKITKSSKYLIQTLLIPISILNCILVQDIISNTNKIISIDGIIHLDVVVIFINVVIFFLEFTYYKVIIRIINFKEDNNSFQFIHIIYILASLTPIFFLEIELGIIPKLIICISILSILMFIHYKNIFNNSILGYYAIILFIFSFLIGNFINNNNYKNHRTSIVENLKQISSKTDPETELILKTLDSRFKKDSILEQMILIKDNFQLEKYIKGKYLYELSIKYHIEIITCFENETILIQPNSSRYSCFDYFAKRISNAKLLNNSNNIYSDNNISKEKGYIGYFTLNNKGNIVNILIDCLEKKKSNEMGYPDLLIDDNTKDFISDYKIYNYGKYIDDKLVLQVGNHNYPQTCDFDTNNWTERNGYYYYVTKKEGNIKWITSVQKKDLYNFISAPSYIFIFSSIIFIISILLFNPKSLLSIKNMNLKNSIQFTIIGVFIISFIIFGWISINYYFQINNNSNRDTLLEKTQSICIELEKYYDNPSITIDQTNSFVINLSNSFLTDINIYDTNGYLTNTSRQSIFSQGITSRLIVKSVLDELKSKQEPILIKEENIGSRKYTASYMPIKNSSNQTISYLHIPFIIQQKNIEDKSIELIYTFSNICLIWVIISLVISYALSSYIILPLKQINDKLKIININKNNEKIYWKRDDELGELITSYNSMVDKLEYNTLILKKNEREGAWRELAKQVAHDIKNPLTPMKLSIQQLQRLQKTDIAKFHEKFESISPALIEQIDTLSDITSEFSDYAKNNTYQKANINECINSAIKVYQSNDNYKIILNNYSKNDICVLCDKQQLIRVFNNLVKNAIQAISKENNGFVEINIKEINNECIISIFDNGVGISHENSKKIFSSQFTTKIDGTGIGLSIVKSIIESIGGRIYFESKENKGTIFTIHLPIIKQ